MTQSPHRLTSSKYRSRWSWPTLSETRHPISASVGRPRYVDRLQSIRWPSLTKLLSPDDWQRRTLAGTWGRRPGTERGVPLPPTHPPPTRPTDICTVSLESSDTRRWGRHPAWPREGRAVWGPLDRPTQPRQAEGGRCGRGRGRVREQPVSRVR